jgi:hypothetical protein
VIHRIVREEVLSIIVWQANLLQVARNILAWQMQSVGAAAIVYLFWLEPLLYGRVLLSRGGILRQ